jgi:hypothetical protein
MAHTWLHWPRVVWTFLALGGLLASTGPGRAGMISLDFQGLHDGDNNAAVQNYLQSVVSAAHLGGTVTVTGAVASTAYNADGHVVGPVNGDSVSSFTLFNEDHNPFLMNSGKGENGDRITLVFNFKVHSVSFDYEIFPDGTPHQPPDFTFAADGKTVLKAFGETPTAGSLYPHSPSSGWNDTEHSAQLLGTGSWSFAGGVTELEFIDWPAHIAISNLRISDTPAPAPPPASAPEPASWLLVTFGLAGLPLLRRSLRARRASSAAHRSSTI